MVNTHDTRSITALLTTKNSNVSVQGHTPVIYIRQDVILYPHIQNVLYHIVRLRTGNFPMVSIGKVTKCGSNSLVGHVLCRPFMIIYI